MEKDEINDLKRGQLHLNCTLIELSNHDGSEQISGPGIIQQTSSGEGFEFTVFVSEALSLRAAFAPILQTDGLQSGVLLPDAFYWTLRASDVKAREWTAERIMRPGRSGSMNASGHVVTGECSELVIDHQNRKSSGVHFLELRTFTTFQFPKNGLSLTTTTHGTELGHEESRRNIANFAAGGFEFRLIDFEDEIVLRATSSATQMHRFFEVQVTDALRFCLGTNIRWSVIYQGNGDVSKTTLRSHKSISGNRNVEGPISIADFMNSADVWRLFELYLAFVAEHDGPQLHPLSRNVFAVVKSRNGSEEAQALTLAVEVETLLSNFFPKHGGHQVDVDKSVNSLLNYMSEWNGDESIKRRAMGSLGQLKSVRPSDKLRTLLAEGAVSEPNVKAWSKLRNSVAHGHWTGFENLQSLIDQVGSVQVLFYQLIFHLIGYRGPQTDWGSHGWPMISYPPTPQW